MNCNKKIRGSAVVDEDGFFVFTPYNTGKTEKHMTLVKSTPYGALWKSKKAFIIRLKFDRKSTPLLHAVVATVMDLYHAAKGETA